MSYFQCTFVRIALPFALLLWILGGCVLVAFAGEEFSYDFNLPDVRVWFPTENVAPGARDGIGFTCEDAFPGRALRFSNEQFSVELVSRDKLPNLRDVQQYLDGNAAEALADWRAQADTSQVTLKGLKLFTQGRIRCSGYPGVQYGMEREIGLPGFSMHAWIITRMIVTDKQRVILRYVRNRNSRFTDVLAEVERAKAELRAEMFFSTLRIPGLAPAKTPLDGDPRGLWIVADANGSDDALAQNLLEIRPDGTVLREGQPWAAIAKGKVTVNGTQSVLRGYAGTLTMRKADALLTLKRDGAPREVLVTIVPYGGQIAMTADLAELRKKYDELREQTRKHSSLAWVDEAIRKERQHVATSVGDEEVTHRLIELAGLHRQGSMHSLAWNALDKRQRDLLTLHAPDVAHLRHQYQQLVGALPRAERGK